MRNQLTRLIQNQSGAITIDWVVLMAAIVGLGVAILSTVQTGVQDLSTDLNGYLSQQSDLN